MPRRPTLSVPRPSAAPRPRRRRSSRRRRAPSTNRGSGTCRVPAAARRSNPASRRPGALPSSRAVLRRPGALPSSRAVLRRPGALPSSRAALRRRRAAYDFGVGGRRTYAAVVTSVKTQMPTRPRGSRAQRRERSCAARLPCCQRCPREKIRTPQFSCVQCDARVTVLCVSRRANDAPGADLLCGISAGSPFLAGRGEALVEQSCLTADPISSPCTRC